MAPPRQAEWQRASSAFTCTLVGFVWTQNLFLRSQGPRQGLYHKAYHPSDKHKVPKVRPFLGDVRKGGKDDLCLVFVARSSLSFALVRESAMTPVVRHHRRRRLLTAKIVDSGWRLPTKNFSSMREVMCARQPWWTSTSKSILTHHHQQRQQQL
jgi:hypothetical protein